MYPSNVYGMHYFSVSNALSNRFTTSSLPNSSIVSNKIGPTERPVISTLNNCIIEPGGILFSSAVFLNTASTLAVEKSVVLEKASLTFTKNAGAPSFHFFTITPSSYFSGAKKKKLLLSQNSL